LHIASRVVARRRIPQERIDVLSVEDDPLGEITFPGTNNEMHEFTIESSPTINSPHLSDSTSNRGLIGNFEKPLSHDEPFDMVESSDHRDNSMEPDSSSCSVEPVDQMVFPGTDQMVKRFKVDGHGDTDFFLAYEIAALAGFYGCSGLFQNNRELGEIELSKPQSDDLAKRKIVPTRARTKYIIPAERALKSKRLHEKIISRGRIDLIDEMLFPGTDQMVKRFKVDGHGDTDFFLATQIARLAGIDAYRLFRVIRELGEIKLSESQREDLANRKIVPRRFRVIYVIPAEKALKSERLSGKVMSHGRVDEIMFPGTNQMVKRFKVDGHGDTWFFLASEIAALAGFVSSQALFRSNQELGEMALSERQREDMDNRKIVPTMSTKYIIPAERAFKSERLHDKIARNRSRDSKDPMNFAETNRMDKTFKVCGYGNRRIGDIHPSRPHIDVDELPDTFLSSQKSLTESVESGGSEPIL
jgi:hypothetical protein